MAQVDLVFAGLKTSHGNPPQALEEAVGELRPIFTEVQQVWDDLQKNIPRSQEKRA